MALPFELPTPAPEVQAQQRADRDRLVRAALFAADEQIINTYPAQLTGAERTRISVTAAIGYLIGHDLITAKPADEWPEYLNMRIPAHLEPSADQGENR